MGCRERQERRMYVQCVFVVSVPPGCRAQGACGYFVLQGRQSDGDPTHVALLLEFLLTRKSVEQHPPSIG